MRCPDRDPRTDALPSPPGLRPWFPWSLGECPGTFSSACFLPLLPQPVVSFCSEQRPPSTPSLPESPPGSVCPASPLEPAPPSQDPP